MTNDERNPSESDHDSGLFVNARWSTAGSRRSDTYDLTSPSDEGRHAAMVSNPSGASSGITAQDTSEKVIVVERLELGDAPRVIDCGGVRLSVPRGSLRDGIGPITVEQTAELMHSDGGDVHEYAHAFTFVVVQAVHCLPAGCSFDSPLTLRFVVGDMHVRWWDRKAAREDTLREYKICSRQSKDDPWREMRPDDVSVAWDERGRTCLRARVNHFTLFGLAKGTTKTSTHIVSTHRGESVLVFNSTSSVAHVTSLPISSRPTRAAKKYVSFTFGEAGIRFDAGVRKRKVMPPANASSEIVPAGGMTELFLGGSAKETKLIVCFLPDRSTAGGHAAPPREAGPGSGSYPAGRLPTDGHERLYREATGGPAVPTTESATGALDTAAAEGWVSLAVGRSAAFGCGPIGPGCWTKLASSRTRRNGPRHDQGVACRQAADSVERSSHPQDLHREERSHLGIVCHDAGGSRGGSGVISVNAWRACARSAVDWRNKSGLTNGTGTAAGIFT
ncbi:unnamed protein product [Scytosiphon promiscuus]